MNRLPQQLPIEQLSTKWAAILNPVLANQLIDGQLLENIKLINGTTIVNHKLGRKLVGYIVVMNNAPSTIYSNQAINQLPQLTLSLISDTDCTVSLWVF